MGLPKRRARNTTFVCLARRNEIPAASCELLISFENVQDICDYQTAINSSDVHLTILVYGNGTWQCANNFRCLCAGQNFFSCLVLKYPAILGALIVFNVHVVLKAVQTRSHFYWIYNFEGFFSAYIHNREHRSVVGSNMYLQVGSPGKTSFFFIPALTQVRTTSLLHVTI